MTTERLMLQVLHSSSLRTSLAAFLLDKEASRCTPKTLEHYEYTLGGFISWLGDRGVDDVGRITPHDIRGFLVSLQRRGLKDTTQHAHARGIKAWLNWLVREGDLETSPMSRVSMPKLDQRVPPSFLSEDIARLLEACDRRRARGARDYAIVLTLLDTGLRAAEICGLGHGDVDMRSGLTTILGKGQKQRTVRLGTRARSAVLRMLGYRECVAPGAPLWMGYDVNGKERGRITPSGLLSILVRLGSRAGVTSCGPHRFRRTFALWCLRDGMDLHSLRMLMGHSSLAVLQRYLALAGEDIERAHIAHSPVDRLLRG